MARLHWDMTSISVYGAYDDPDEGFVTPGNGHPTDRRVDLKQVQTGLAVSGDGGVPVFHRAYDGGAGEVAQVVGAMTTLKQLAGQRWFLLIGDSKPVSYPNLRAVISCWRDGDIQGLEFEGVTFEEAHALDRPAMTIMRGQLRTRLAGRVHRAYWRWLHPTSSRLPRSAVRPRRASPSRRSTAGSFPGRVTDGRLASRSARVAPGGGPARAARRSETTSRSDRRRRNPLSGWAGQVFGSLRRPGRARRARRSGRR